MLRFQRALLRELLLVFGGVLAVVTVVVFLGTILGLVVKGEGAGLGLVFNLIPTLIPLALAYSVPFSWLAAVTLVIGRMVQDREITALRTAGLHLRTVAVPVIAVGVLVTTTTMAFTAYGVQNAQRSLKAGIRAYLPIFLGSLKDVDRTIALSNGRFSFARYEQGAFWDIELDRRDPRGGLEFKIIARNAYILRTGDGEDDSLRFTFEDGYVLASTETGEPLLDREPATSIQMGRAQQVGFSVLFNEFFGTGRYIDQARDMSLSSLMYANERGGVWRGTRRRVGVAMHRSIALGCAPLAMGLFALAMGLLLPATGRRVRDFVLCFLTPVVLYFPLFLAGPALGRQGTLPAWLAMWNANIVVGVLGLLLLAVAFRR